MIIRAVVFWESQTDLSGLSGLCGRVVGCLYIRLCDGSIVIELMIPSFSSMASSERTVGKAYQFEDLASP